MEDPQHWVTRETELAWGNQWYQVIHDRVELPDGSMIDYYLSRRPDFAIVVAMTDSREVVLVRQYRHGAGTVVTEFPAGCLNPEESPVQAAARELLEETGYECSSLTPAATFFDDACRNTNRAHVFIGRGAHLVGSPRLDAVEAASGVRTILVPISRLPELIDRGDISGATFVAAVWSALRHIAPLTPGKSSLDD